MSRPDEPGRVDGEVPAAARFALLSTLAGVAFLVLAAFSVRNCDAASHAPVCGSTPRLLLGGGGPLILLIGGIGAFGRTYQNWRRRKPWWAWQGAGWFLMALMAVALVMGLPPIAGVGGG